MSLAASAQDGISAVGANIVILPSTYWSNAAYTAKVLVVHSGTEYGE